MIASTVYTSLPMFFIGWDLQWSGKIIYITFEEISSPQVLHKKLTYGSSICEFLVASSRNKHYFSLLITFMSTVL